MKKLYIAADYRGVELKEQIINSLQSQKKYDFEDLGIERNSSLDYVDISKALAEKMLGQNAVGVMICRSGQGVTIALNRFNHIRACVCRNKEDVINVRKKLNANVICLGSDYSNCEDVLDMIDIFEQQEFIQERHGYCVDKLIYKQANHSNINVNLIVRGIIIQQSHILLTQASKDNLIFANDLYFLPGGHVEYNESAEVAIKREIMEEIGLIVKNLSPKGSLECSWDRNGKIYHEINLVFDVEVENLDINTPPISLDHKLQVFVWKKLSEVQDLKILPNKLKEIIFDSKYNFYSEMEQC